VASGGRASVHQPTNSRHHLLVSTGYVAAVKPLTDAELAAFRREVLAHMRWVERAADRLRERDRGGTELHRMAVLAVYALHGLQVAAATANLPAANSASIEVPEVPAGEEWSMGAKPEGLERERRARGG
jgi:hypothetical protein